MKLFDRVRGWFGLSVPADVDPIHNFYYGDVSRPTAAGISVNENTALNYSACWAATMLLSTSGGMLPLKPMRYLPTGGSEVAYDHRTYPIVHDAPNPEMSSMMFRSSRLAFQVNWGNAFGEIVRDRGGMAREVWPIHNSRIPKANVKRRGNDGRLYYLVNNDDGSQQPIPAEDMLHIPSPMSYDGIWGIGVVEMAKLSIGFGLVTEMQGAAYAGTGAQPGVALKNGKFRSEDDRRDFRRQWIAKHGQPGTSGEVYLLPEGSEIQVLNFNPQQSQYIETRQHNIEEIARWYGVPQHLIQHLLRSTNNNIEHQSLEFVKFSLMRWLVSWEQELNRKLLSKEEQRTYFFKHNVDALERADISTRTTALAQQFFNGEITLNEWRALEDRKPIGELGDKHFIQTAMAPLESVANPPEPEAPDEPEPVPVVEQDDEPTLSSTVKEALATITATMADVQAKQTNALTALATTVVQLREQSEQVQQMLHSHGLAISGLQGDVRQQSASQKQSASAMLRDVMARMVSLEVNKIKREAEKPSRFPDRIQEFYATHTATLARELTGPVAACLAAGGDEREPGEVVQTIATAHVAESLRQLTALTEVPVSEFPAKVEECVSKWHEERATVKV